MPGRTTLLGTAVHAAIEETLSNDLDLNGAIGYAVDGLRELLETTQHRADLGIDEALKLSANVIGTWFTEVLPLLDLTGEVHIERQFTRELFSDERRTISIQGTIDLVDGSTLWDWKTGNMVYRPERVRTAKETVQHVVYCAAMSDCLPDMSHTFRYAFTPRKGGMSIVDVAPTAADYRWLLRELQGMADLIEARPASWPIRPTDWWCSDKFCPVYGNCRGLIEREVQ